MQWVTLLLLISKFSLVFAFDRLIIMGFSVCSLWIHSTGIHWVHWMFIFTSFIHIGKFRAIIYSNNLSTYLSLYAVVHNVFYLKFHRSLKLCYLFFIFLFFCYSNLLISTILSSSWLTLSSVLLNLCLNSSSKFSISVILVYSARISFWFFVLFSLYWYFYFVHTLLFLHFTCPPSALNIYKTVDSRSLSSRTAISGVLFVCFSGTDTSVLLLEQILLVYFFFPLNRSYFPIIF